MNAQESALLLTHVSAFDGREVTRVLATAWASALPDVALDEAIEALPAFYRTATRDTRNWIQPGDVLAGVRRVRSAKVANAYSSALVNARDAGLDDEDAAMAALAAAKAARDDLTPLAITAGGPRMDGYGW